MSLLIAAFLDPLIRVVSHFLMIVVRFPDTLGPFKNMKTRWPPGCNEMEKHAPGGNAKYGLSSAHRYNQVLVYTYNFSHGTYDLTKSMSISTLRTSR